jgi:hypothetical protein
MYAINQLMCLELMDLGARNVSVNHLGYGCSSIVD